MQTPAFWSSDNAVSRALSPLGVLYGALACLRRNAQPYRAPVPVLCIGNVTAGGAGKTPVALAFGKRALSRGIAVAFLSRGYGGTLEGPIRVDPQVHTAVDVGDEPLLLAQVAPAWISRDRAKGAAAAASAGAELIIMDDGLQNPHVIKDMTLLVIDAAFGFGNGRLIPAGPLREPVAKAARRCRAAILVGDGALDQISLSVPTIRASLRPASHNFAQQKVLAFAGIGRPEKFRGTLQASGVEIVDWRPFADHHVYAVTEIEDMADRASRLGAVLVTTEKDYIRLPVELRKGIEVFAVDLLPDDPQEFEVLLDELVRKATP